MKKLIPVSLLLSGMIIMQAEARVVTSTTKTYSTIPVDNNSKEDGNNNSDDNSGSDDNGNNNGSNNGDNTDTPDPRNAIYISRYIQFSESLADKEKMVFHISFSKRVKEDIDLHYAISAGKGFEVGKDIRTPSYVVHVPRGAKKAKIYIDVINDKDVEETEYFSLTLQKPSSDYTFWKQSSDVTIMDDEISLKDIDTDGNYAIKEHGSSSDKITTKTIEIPFKIDIDAKAGFEILTDESIDTNTNCSKQPICDTTSYDNNGEVKECVKECVTTTTVTREYSDKMDIDRVILHTYDEYDKSSNICINEREKSILSSGKEIVSGSNFSLDLLPKVTTPCAWIEVQGKSEKEFHDEKKSFVGKSDTFAIKPDHFKLPKNLVAKAGEYKPFPVLAEDNLDKKSALFDEKNGVSFIIEAKQKNSACSYDDSDFDLSKLDKFNNGKITQGTISYNNVGNLDLTIHEIKGSEFASIDRSDTPEAKRFIKPDSTTMKFVPSSFKTAVNFTNNHTTAGYAFYSNTPEHGTVWDIATMAVDKNGKVLKNYNSTCFEENANNVNFDMDLNVTSNADLALISSIGGAAIDSEFKRVKLHSIFPNFDEGKSSTKVAINFNRSIDTAKAPAEVVVDKITIKDPDVTKVRGSVDPKGGVDYRYMRTYLQSPIEVVGAHELNTTIYYETYLPSNAKVQTASKTVSKWHSSISGDSDWMQIDYHHDIGYGGSKFTYISASYIEPNRSIPTKIGDTILNVKSINIPEKNIITMNPIDEFTYKNSVMTNISFLPNTVNWAGDGKTGITVDTQVARRSAFKKMGW